MRVKIGRTITTKGKIMLTNESENVTREKVAAELAELEAIYRKRKKVLRALLAVLETEKLSEKEAGE